MNKDFELEMTPLTDAELNEVDGGVGEAGGRWKSVKCAVKKNYLALRNHPSFKYENEIARIYRGTVFSVYTGKTSARRAATTSGLPTAERPAGLTKDSSSTANYRYCPV